MLGIRYALQYPDQTEQPVLVDPIGLEDWLANGVPSISVDQWYDRELHTTAERIRNYERNTYFAGQWRADYEPWVQMLAGMYRRPDRARVAWDAALLYDMILTQPVYYELPQIKAPTLLIVGDKDTTAIGKEFAPPEIRPTLGNYPRLAHEAAAAIPHAKLVEFPASSHAPQLQERDALNAALLKGMAQQHNADRLIEFANVKLPFAQTCPPRLSLYGSSRHRRMTAFFRRQPHERSR